LTWRNTGKEKMVAAHARSLASISVQNMRASGADPIATAIAKDLTLHGVNGSKKILNGAEPADTAVEQIHKTRLDTNMKTARTQGLKIPDSIRLRAEELIE